MSQIVFRKFASAHVNRPIWAETKGASITCSEEQIKLVFERCDSDQDGQLTKKELKKALSELGVEFPNVRAMSALWHADENGDGRVNPNELASLVKYASTLTSADNAY